MMGDANNTATNPGLYLLAAQEVFGILDSAKYERFHVFISFFEIYCGKVFDIINDRQLLNIREDGKQTVNIVGLQEKRVSNIQQVMALINKGNSVRVTGVY